jgi:hypothetical protein
MEFDFVFIVGPEPSKLVVEPICVGHTIYDRSAIRNVPFPDAGGLVVDGSD